MRETNRYVEEVRVFREHGGMLRAREAIRLGIHPRDFYAMRSAGRIEPVSRGLYRLSGMPVLAHPDLTIVGRKVPQGVVCLISALAFHGITLQVPHEIDVALRSGSEKPRLEFPPTHYVWLSGPSFSSGIETHQVDGVTLKVYSPEKTVADCFKFRNKIGLNVAIEALKLCREKKRSKPDVLMKFAKICRVEKVMKPYLEALL